MQRVLCFFPEGGGSAHTTRSFADIAPSRFIPHPLDRAQTRHSTEYAMMSVASAPAEGWMDRLKALPCAIEMQPQPDLMSPAADVVVMIGKKELLASEAMSALVPQDVPYDGIVESLSPGNVNPDTASSFFPRAGGKGASALAQLMVCCTSSAASRHNSPLRPDQMWQFCKKQVCPGGNGDGL